jgi:hypothetical protein
MTLDFLTHDEIERITCRERVGAQIRKLDNMRIPYMLDGNGCPLVLRTNIIKQLLGEPERKEAKPDLARAFARLAG